MKSSAIVLLLAVTFARVHSSSAISSSNANGSTGAHQCPDEFELHVQSKGNNNNNNNDNNVTTKCRTSQPDNDKSIYSVVPNDYDWRLSVQLPACKNVTLQSDEFKVSAGNSLTITLGKVITTIVQFRLHAIANDSSSSSSSADVCYPLSPQLLQCPLRKLNRSDYTVLPNRTLTKIASSSSSKSDRIGFRDYYPIPDAEEDDAVVACNETVNESRLMRCNFVDYKPDEYRFTDDGLRLLLLPSNATIYRPTYTTDERGHVNVCHPLSPQFTHCLPWTLTPNEYAIRANRKLMDNVHEIEYDVRDYVVLRSGDAVTCHIPPTSSDAAEKIYYVNAVLYLVSAVCLCVAFVVHLLVPSLNYHAKPLLCHMMCMTIMFTALAIRKFLTNIDPLTCYPLFVATHYSALASFFWLNVLSFDLWAIFANLQTTSSGCGGGGGRRGWLSCCACACSCQFNAKRRIHYYGAYALGLPMVFTVAAVVVDRNAALQKAVRLRPGIDAMCWFNERPSAYVFFYIPMMAVLGVNLVLFVATVVNLRRAGRGAEVVNKKLNTQLLIVCFKLFIIMGFCWIGEAIAWTVNASAAAFYVPDFINAVQGLIIFLIYICKPATYRLLRDKFWRRRLDSDGKWTTDFNMSRGNSRNTSTTGVSVRSISNGRGSVPPPTATASRDKICHKDSSSSGSNTSRRGNAANSACTPNRRLPAKISLKDTNLRFDTGETV